MHSEITLPTIRKLPSLLLVVIFSLTALAGCSSESTDHASIEINLVIENDILRGENTLRAKQNDTVTFNITSNQTGMIHIHGYDLAKQIEANYSISFVMETNATGRFIIAFHREMVEPAIKDENHDHGDMDDPGHGDMMEIELGYLEVAPN